MPFHRGGGQVWEEGAPFRKSRSSVLRRDSVIDSVIRVHGNSKLRRNRQQVLALAQARESSDAERFRKRSRLALAQANGAKVLLVAEELLGNPVKLVIKHRGNS